MTGAPLGAGLGLASAARQRSWTRAISAAAGSVS